MALPIIPIILAVTALGSGIAQGISAVKNSKAEAKAIQQSTTEQINERARQAKKLMQQQKTSFLKGGVYFDSGSPLDVINETYEFMDKDIKTMANDANKQIKNLTRQGKTAFASSIVQGVANAAMSYFGASAMGGALSSGSAGAGIAGSASTAKNNFMNWWQNLSGKYRGGFGPVSNNALNNNVTKIV